MTCDNWIIITYDGFIHTYVAVKIRIYAKMIFNKKLTLASAVIAALVCGTAYAEGEAATPSPVTVDGGKITFEGKVTSGACAIKSGDTAKIVTLDTVKADTFTAADQLANAKKPFDITLENCNTDTIKTVQVTFNGQTVEGKPGVLANTAGVGSAQNVGLQIFNSDGSALNIGDLSSKIALTGTTTIPLSVDYKSTGAKVTAGSVQSAANFTLTYN